MKDQRLAKVRKHVKLSKLEILNFLKSHDNFNTHTDKNIDWSILLSFLSLFLIALKISDYCRGHNYVAFMLKQYAKQTAFIARYI